MHVKNIFKYTSILSNLNLDLVHAIFSNSNPNLILQLFWIYYCLVEQQHLITFSEWNEETFVYGHFAMVVPTRHAIFPNAWEYLEVRKDKHHF